MRMIRLRLHRGFLNGRLVGPTGRYNMDSDPVLTRPPRDHDPEMVDRIALLDAFLEDIAARTSLRRAAAFTTTPTRSASPQVLPNEERDGSSGTMAAGGSTGMFGEGDIRAVTSGGLSGSIASPQDTGWRPDVQEIQEEVLRVLDFLFYTDRTLVDSCAQVLDKSRVVKIVARETRRSVWLVQGSRGSPYLCLRQYCSCRSFQELLRRSVQPVLCKHLLAVRLAPALGVAREEEVEDDKLVTRMSTCDYG